MGVPGVTGFTGSQGVQGIQGTTGFTGSQGIGFTGSQGVIGFTGSSGSGSSTIHRSIIQLSDGGSITSDNTWTKLTLNSEVHDSNALTSISSSVISLISGKYFVIASIWMGAQYNTVASDVGVFLRLRNTSDSNTIAEGGGYFTVLDGAFFNQNEICFTLQGYIDITSTKSIELQGFKIGDSDPIVYVGSGITANVQSRISFIKVE